MAATNTSAITPNENDVLFGKGIVINSHVGNERFRRMVRPRRAEFASARRKEKRAIATSIAEEVRALSPPGRFLAEDRGDEVGGVVGVLQGGGELPGAASWALAGSGGEVGERTGDDGGGNDNGIDNNNGKVNGKVNPKLFRKAWVEVDFERVVIKVMHRLREKDKEEEEGEAASADGETSRRQNDNGAFVIPPAIPPVPFPPRQVPGEPGSGSVELNAARPNSPAPGQPGDDKGTPLLERLGNVVDTGDGSTGDGTEQLGKLGMANGAGEPPGDFQLRWEQFGKLDAANGAGAAAEPGKTGGQDSAGKGGQERFAVDVDGGGRSASNHFDGACTPFQLTMPPPILASALVSPALPSVAAVQQSDASYRPSSADDESARGSAGYVPLGDARGDFPPREGAAFLEGDFTSRIAPMPEANCTFTKDQTLMSVAELLVSGWLSSHCMVLPWEGDRNASAAAAAAVAAASTPTDDEGRRRTRTLENSTRVAWMVARALVDSSLPPLDLPSLRLENFLVLLTSPPKHHRVDEGLPPEEVVRLCRIGVVSPAMGVLPQESVERSGARAICALGRLLYSVFSGGEAPPPSLFQKSTPSLSSQGDDDTRSSSGRRSAKSFRARRESIFSRLVESDVALPKSVCRLLSDAMGAGRPRGQADAPFARAEDVVADLERMVSHPSVFLHNARNVWRPLFGHEYHGRNHEVKSLRGVIARMESSLTQEVGCLGDGVEAVFVSGIAGSGKSRFVQSVAGGSCPPSRWTVVSAKFERGKEHASRNILSSMFDSLLSNLIRMREWGDAAEVVRSERVSRAILNAVGQDRLAWLAELLPSVLALFPSVCGANVQSQTKDGEWRLVYSLSRIVEAVLEEDRFLMICCDDLQWADKMTLSLLSEVLVSVGSLKHVSRRCLFVGIFRHDEVDENHPFSVQYTYLQMMVSNVGVTAIGLSSLSKDDVADLISWELRLPPRLVSELADVVHKRTTGHAFFVVELLNSFLRDFIVAYSSELCRYTWDNCRIAIVETGDSVAELIAANLNTLPPESLRILQVLSCFGIQTEDNLLQMLDSFHKGIFASIDAFVETGILDRAATIVIFSHDLIQQAAYESMSPDERKSLHLRIGYFLGSSVDGSLAVESVSKVFGRLGLKDQVVHAGRNMTSTHLSIACDQVNSAGPDSICDENMLIKFATWNLQAAQSFSRQSNFSAALYYYSNGIAFLGQGCWHLNYLLSFELYQGAALSSFALGEAERVEEYAEKIIARVPFKESLTVQHLLLKTLGLADRHEESISRGIDALNRLGFHIPPVPSNESIMIAMASTADMASQYSSDQISSLCRQTKDDSAYAAVKIVDSIFASLYDTSSPLFPLIACEVVKFSLRNSCCLEAAMCFATYGFFRIYLADDYSGGKYWSDLARKIILCNPNKNKSSECRCEILLLNTIDAYFDSPTNVASKLITCYNDSMKIGQVDIAMASLFQAWRCRLFGGHNLSLILQSFGDRLEPIAKETKWVSKYMALDAAILKGLTGKDIDCYSIYDESISCLDDLISEAQSSNDSRWLNNFHACQMYLNFWEGDFLSAEEHFHIACAHPSSKMPRFISIYLAFFGGLVALHLAKVNDSNDARLKCGREMIEKLEKWSNNAMHVFGNKSLLLQAEYSASLGEYSKAQLLYQSSIKAAKDHGNIHELALAHELLGNHLCATNGRGLDSDECFRKACMYYEQWGAKVLSERLMHKYNLKRPGTSKEIQLGSSKHQRHES